MGFFQEQARVQQSLLQQENEAYTNSSLCA